jgi:hypothetical protein
MPLTLPAFYFLVLDQENKRTMCNSQKTLWACGCTKESGGIGVCHLYKTINAGKKWRSGVCPYENSKIWTVLRDRENACRRHGGRGWRECEGEGVRCVVMDGLVYEVLMGA